MRAPLLALAVLLAVPALAVPAPPGEEISHGAIAPYMHIAALSLPPGIRPGAWLQIGPADCTASFVVRDTAGALYITTAGHCTQAIGEVVRVTQDAAIAALAPPLAFGQVVARWPLGLDAALVRIDPDKHGLVNPSMVGWGGPTGVATGAPETYSLTRHYGWGWWTWMDHATRCRSGVLSSFGGTTWWYVGPVGNGDSGSAVMTADGLALGILDWGGTGAGVPLLGPGVFLSGGGVRFDRALAALEQVTGLDLQLVTGGPVNDVCEANVPV